MDDNELSNMERQALEEQKKQEKLDDASQKTAHLLGKAAASYLGGSEASELYDQLSDSKYLKEAENLVGKVLQQNPIDKKAIKLLNDSGSLDKLDTAMSLADSNPEKLSKDVIPKDMGTNNNPLKEDLGNNDDLKNQLQKNSITLNDKSSDNNLDIKVQSDSEKTELANENKETGIVTDDSENSKEANKNLISNLFDSTIDGGLGIIKILFIIVGSLLIIFFITIFLLFAYMFESPFSTAKNFINSVKNGFSTFFGTIVSFLFDDQQTDEQEYYEELSRVQTEIKDDYNICIDINLITATLTVNRSFEDIINEDQEEVTDVDDEDNEIPYKKIKKQVKLLANMQLMRKNYGLDQGLYDDTGSYCIEEDSSYQQYELVNSENLDNYKKDNIFSANGLDSSTYELIAEHDLSSFGKFFTKKSNEERNYAYYFYRPYFDEDGDCDDELPDEEVEVSIGNYETRIDSVYYWNLINSFIPDYYDEFLPDDESERTKKIKEMADDIYLLYDEIGPSQTCYVNSSYICRSDEGADFYGGGDTKLSIDEFTQNVSPIAIDEMTRTGIFASITLSQAALESSNGASGLSKNYSNYYGMTAGSCAPSQSPDTVTGSVLQPGEGGNTCTGNQFWNGSIVALCNSQGEDCQWYRIYDSFANSTRDHSRLLAQSYGCNVYSTYSEQLDCLVAHGYATDAKYKDKITTVITSYNLSDYDIGTFSGTYQDVTDNTFVNSLCYGDGVVTYAGEFTSWKQYDSRWKSVKLGTSTVGKIGCAMTSVTIQILRSGVNNILGNNLNPGTFATTLTELGGFTADGSIYWSSVAKIAPNFQFVNAIRGHASPSEIAEKVNSGYFVILNVKNGRHWVAVDRVEGDKIYMFDPGSGGNEVGQTYGINSIVGYVYYKRG